MATPINPTDMTVHLLWINSGLSCDGDSVSLTNATLPSVEDIVMGAIPGLPKVVPHWPLVDFQVGHEFMQWFWKADAGELDPFVLVVEGSIPNEEIKSEGYWAAFRQQRTRHEPVLRPADEDQRVARSPRAEGDGDHRGRHVCDLRRHPCDGGKSHWRDGRA
jgi:Ni,Fe-hydrogenase I small subunit